MPRPRKSNWRAASAAVEILDDDDAPQTSADRKRSELFEGAAQRATRRGPAGGHRDDHAHSRYGHPPGQSDSSMGDDYQALQLELERQAHYGTEMMSDMRHTVVDTVDIAEQTGEKLSAQSDQLVRIKAGIDETRSNVQDAQPVVEELRHGRVKRFVRKPFTSTRDRVNRRAVDRAARETSAVADARVTREERGVRALQESKLKVNVDDDDDDDFAPDIGQSMGRSYAEYKNESVRRALRQQDAHLEEISAGVANLGQYANAYKAELDYQAEVVDSIDAEDVKHRVQGLTKELHRVR